MSEQPVRKPVHGHATECPVCKAAIDREGMMFIMCMCRITQYICDNGHVWFYRDGVLMIGKKHDRDAKAFLERVAAKTY